jgi:hypothetical protein
MKDDGTGKPPASSSSSSTPPGVTGEKAPTEATPCPAAAAAAGGGVPATTPAGPGLVVPSGPPDPNATAGGTPTKINPKDDDATKRSLNRENESAQILAKNGFQVDQNPPKLPNGAKPDFKIEGEYFDCYSPSSNNERMITDTIDAKVPKQADRLVFNLADSPMSPEEMRDVVKRKQDDEPVKNGSLKQVIAIKKDGTVENIYP